MKNVLIINAHQTYEGMSSGSLNRELVSVMQEYLTQNGYTTKLTYIEKGYDINEEIEKHLWADIIITQSPVYWLGNPWIYKKYIDEIFTAALIQESLVVSDGRTRKDPSKQYGSGGKMQGKKYMLSLTWNAPEEAFNDPNQRLFAGKSVDDIFAHNTASYKFCGAEPLPSFSCFDVVKAAQVDKDIERLKAHLATVL